MLFRLRRFFARERRGTASRNFSTGSRMGAKYDEGDLY